jgi:hypothetical protein
MTTDGDTDETAGGASADDSSPAETHPLTTRSEALEEQEADLDRRASRQVLLRTVLTGTVFSYCAAALVLGFAGYRHAPGWIVLMATFLIVVIVLQITRNRLRELEDAQQQLMYEQAVLKSKEGKEKAETLFLKHQFELRGYYGQTLRQGASIFYVGVGCLGVGVAVLGAALWIIKTTSATGAEHIVIVTAAALGAVGSIATNYVAYLFLRMHRTAMNAIGDFHATLVETQNIHFSQLFLSNLTGTDLAGASRAIAEKLASRGRAGAGKVPAGSDAHDLADTRKREDGARRP